MTERDRASYYSIQWFYSGPFCNCPDDSEDSLAASRGGHRADTEARAIMTLANISFKHQYSWPDGSLFYWGRCYENTDIDKALATAMAKLTREKITGFSTSSVGGSDVRKAFDMEDNANAILRSLADEYPSDLMEALASVEHERWSGWMKYLFTKGSFLFSGDPLSARFQPTSFVINADSVTRWRRQMTTPYKKLSKEEQESDRVEVRKTLQVLRDYLKR